MSLLKWLRRFVSFERIPPWSEPRLVAAVMNARGNAAFDAGNHEEALRCYLDATRLEPRWVVPWSNLGVEHKLSRRWRESRDANARALALDPRYKLAAWNLGIAATALGEWAEARRAWRAFGLEVPEGAGPIKMGLGPVALRVGGKEAPEVVWGVGLGPARARIVTVPMPESGRCRGDLVLHDGLPCGHRLLDGHEVPVFKELDLLAPSHESTWAVEVIAPRPEDLEELLAALERRGLAAEDWTTMVRLLCRACRERNPDLPAERHDERCGRRSGGSVWTSQHTVAIAAECDDALREAVADWAASGSGRGHREPELKLDAAGERVPSCTLALGHRANRPPPT